MLKVWKAEGKVNIIEGGDGASLHIREPMCGFVRQQMHHTIDNP